MDLEQKYKAYRLIAYSSLVFSVGAVLAISVAMPTAFNYLKSAKLRLAREISFCHRSAGDVQNDVTQIKTNPFELFSNRTVRQAYGGGQMGSQTSGTTGGGTTGGGTTSEGVPLVLAVAQLAVFLVPQDHRERLADSERQENLEPQVLPDNLEQATLVQWLKCHHVSHAQLVHQDPLVHRDLSAMLDLLDHQAWPVSQPLAHQGLRDHQDLLEVRAKQDRLERMANQQQPHLRYQENLDQQVMLALLVHLEDLENQEPAEVLDQPVQKVLLVRRDLQAQQEILVLQASQENLDCLDSLVFARNIVQLMVAFSSKMVPFAVQGLKTKIVSLQRLT
jgi:hypothetical protein